jgi:hypothetical protein
MSLRPAPTGAKDSASVGNVDNVDSLFLVGSQQAWARYLWTMWTIFFAWAFPECVSQASQFVDNVDN